MQRNKRRYHPSSILVCPYRTLYPVFFFYIVLIPLQIPNTNKQWCSVVGVIRYQRIMIAYQFLFSNNQRTTTTELPQRIGIT